MEFFHSISLLASNWPLDYGLTVITAMNRDDYMTMNIKLSVAEKIKNFIAGNYEKIYKEVSHEIEATLFMIEVAGYLGIKDASPILEDLYENGNNEEKLRSMKALSDLGVKKFADSFYNDFISEKDPVFQTLKFKCFLRISSTEHVGIIEKELKNRNWFVRYAAAKKFIETEEGLKCLKANRGLDVTELALAESGYVDGEISV